MDNQITKLDLFARFQAGEYALVCQHLEPRVLGVQTPNWKESHLLLLAYAELKGAEFNSYSKSIALKTHPNRPGLYFDLGNIFLKKELYAAAIQLFTKALEIHGGYLDARIGLAKALMYQKRYDASQKVISKIESELSSRRFEVLQIASKLKYWGDDFDSALAYSEQSLPLLENTPTAHMNHAVILSDLRRFQEAIPYYEKALQLRPNYEKAHQYIGQVYLHLGELSKGWEHYKWRWQNSDFPSVRIKTSRPMLDYRIQAFPKRTLVWGEQGLGEQVLFATILHLAKSEIEHLIVQIDKRLIPMYTRSFPGIQFEPKETPFAEADYDAYITFGDLVARYRTKLDEVGEHPTPLLSLDQNCLQRVQTVMVGRLSKGPRIGLSWRSVATQYGKLKSISLASLVPILKALQAKYLSLQYGDVSKEILKVSNATGLIVEQFKEVDNTNDLESWASLMACCDLVITTSNVTAHMAGALGKPAIVLQPIGKTLWFWDHRKGDQSLWYPSVKLISEYDYGEHWHERVVAVANELCDFGSQNLESSVHQS